MRTQSALGSAAFRWLDWMTEQLPFVGFDIFAAPLAVLVMAPAIRFVAIESELMRYYRNPSPRFEPLLEMMRLRARYLLKAMVGLFASFLVFLFCAAFANLAPASTMQFAAVLQIIAAGLAGYAAIQMLLEIRLTLIGFTYQEAKDFGEG